MANQILDDYGMDFNTPVMRTAVIEWIEGERCDVAITLAFNKSMHLDIALKRLSQWLYQFEHEIRRCRPSRLPKDKRLLAFVVPEHQASNIHFHLAIRLIDGEDVTPANLDHFLEVGKRLWRQLQPTGTCDLKRIYDGRGWARYITKDHYKCGTELILSHDFHPAG
ncbi:hypothetical protein [Maricaulis sp.]|uniref:hypothetical protein n=1 Tax=Maricaulis sp. TaxID=1486257 RepID=UPI003A94D57D